MTMVFRTAKDALVTILGNAATSGQYTVSGYQRQSLNPEQVANENRRVTVYYKSGEFAPTSSSLSGPVKHEMTFAVELVLAAKSLGDLSTLTDENSTDAERATALANFELAASVADRQMDEFIDVIYNVLMDNRRIRLDDDVNGDLAVNDRWIQRVTKNEPLPSGEYAVLTAEITYTIQAKENILGADAVGILVSNDVDIRVNDDINEGRAGVEE